MGSTAASGMERVEYYHQSDTPVANSIRVAATAGRSG